MRLRAPTKWPTKRSERNFRGIYINLDRAVDRRREMEKEFERHGLEPYLRLPSVDGRNLRAKRVSAAEDGCFRSHANAIELAVVAGVPVHIVEDDTWFSDEAVSWLGHAVEAGLPNEFDIIFLDNWVDIDWGRIAKLEDHLRKHLSDDNAVHLADMSEFRLGAMSSYLIGPRAAEKLSRFLRREVKRGVRSPVDDFVDGLVKSGDITAAVTIPFLTGVDHLTGARSDIQELEPGVMRDAFLLRDAFCIDPYRRRQVLADLNAIVGGDILAGRPSDGHKQFRDLLAMRPA